MLNKKAMLNIILIFLITILLIGSNSYAMVQVTKDNLTQSLPNIMSTEFAQQYGISNMTVGENIISVTSSSGQYDIKYDLSNEPTFTTEVEVREDMSSDEYTSDSQTAGLIAIYGAIASINGVDVNNALQYFALSYLSSVSESDTIISNIPTDDEEFGKKMLEEIKKAYTEPEIYDDSKNLNTYELTFEAQDITETSCKVVITLKIKADADFSKINQIGADEEDPSENDQNENLQDQGGLTTNNQTPQTNQQSQQNQQVSTTNNRNTNDSTKNTQLPKAGLDTKIYVAIMLVVILTVVFGIKYQNLKGIK